jgi:exopolysaccharide biosynthesis polyprenyl glycosylphosphotransferase
MNSESTITQLPPQLAHPWPAARPRIGLRLTAVERKHLLIFTDLILVNGSLLAALTMWSDFSLSPPTLLAHAKWFITLSLLWVIVGTVLDIYNLARSASTTSTMVSAGLAALLSALLYLAIPWLTPPVLRRTYALGFVLLNASTVVAWRILYAQALVQPAFRQRALILGAGKAARALAGALRQAGQADDANPFRGTGYQVVGLVADRPAQPGEDADKDTFGDWESDSFDRADDVPLLGDVRQLVCLVRQHGVDEIVVALDGECTLSPEVREVLLDCRELGLQVNALETVYERLAGRLSVGYAQRDLNLILGPADSPVFRLYAALKRLLDILLALLGLVVLALLMPWVALSNVLCSPGPLFYRQPRAGKGGQPFALLKFRSMIPDAEQATGVMWCGDEDPRITPVGRWLRKTRLDELPQFINVLRGEMSIVGPRPERPHFVGQLVRALPLYRARHAVKPGITGWAQVRYDYGNSVEDSRVKLEYDLYYVKHASFYLDLLILLHTVRVMLGFMGQ